MLASEVKLSNCDIELVNVGFVAGKYSLYGSIIKFFKEAPIMTEQKMFSFIQLMEKRQKDIEFAYKIYQDWQKEFKKQYKEELK